MTTPAFSRGELEEPEVTTKRIILTILAIVTFLLLLAAVTSGDQTDPEPGASGHSGAPSAPHSTLG